MIKYDKIWKTRKKQDEEGGVKQKKNLAANNYNTNGKLILI